MVRLRTTEYRGKVKMARTIFSLFDEYQSKENAKHTHAHSQTDTDTDTHTHTQ